MELFRILFVSIRIVVHASILSWKKKKIAIEYYPSFKPFPLDLYVFVCLLLRQNLWWYSPLNLVLFYWAKWNTKRWPDIRQRRCTWTRPRVRRTDAAGEGLESANRPKMGNPGNSGGVGIPTDPVTGMYSTKATLRCSLMWYSIVPIVWIHESGSMANWNRSWENRVFLSCFF